MSRYFGPKCRLCRREGVKLFLKGARCSSPKCPLEKKGAVPPGQHGLRKSRGASEYGKQLREKQKTKRTYGVNEKQMKNYFSKARKHKTNTGKALFRLLETRLDSVVFRLGFAPSRSVARQIVNHGHVSVNGQRVNIPSFIVKKEDVVTLSSKASKIPVVKAMLGEKEYQAPSWLLKKGGTGKIIDLPKDEELPSEINESLIIEYYSR